MDQAFTAIPNWEATLMSDDIHPNDAGYELMAQTWFDAIAANNVPSLPEFSDTFSGAALSAEWSAHSSLGIKSGELINNSTIDQWNQFIAIPTVINNPRVVEFRYGQSSGAVGRAFTGAAVMLNNTKVTKADGYLVFHNFDKLRLPTMGVDFQNAVVHRNELCNADITIYRI